VFVSGVLAGSLNSIAFGGSLISFPTLVWLGVPPIIANATNTAAMWPGSLGAVWGYRRELRQTTPRMYWLIVPSIFGTIAGAMLLRITPAALFDRLVPVLILFATLLFALQDRPWRSARSRQQAAERKRLSDDLRASGQLPSAGWKWFAGAMIFQFFVSVYGGYFGAGMGILMLAALAILGHDDIHQMNGLKNLLAIFINAVAAAYFVRAGMVVTSDALVMAVGAIIGGVSSAGLARRMGRTAVRRAVIVVGFAMTLALFFRL
jgi:uncharacterized membrane protein YfcA